MIAARLQPKACEQRGGIECGQMLVAGAAAASLELVGSKKAHVTTDARNAEPGRLHLLAMAAVTLSNMAHRTPRE